MKPIARNIFVFLVSFGLLSCAMIDTSIAQTQQDSTKKVVKKKPRKTYRNLIKFNPLPIVWGPIPLTGEYRILREIPIGDHESIQVGISYLGKSPFVSLAENTINSGGGPNGTGTGNTNPNGTLSLNTPEVKFKISGYRLQLNYRIYIGDKYTPNGPYIGPHISYSEAFMSDRYIARFQQYVKVTHFNVNFLAGYQSVVWDKFVLDVFVGLGYKKNRWEENSSGAYKPVNTDDIPLYNFPIKFTLGFNIGIAFE